MKRKRQETRYPQPVGMFLKTPLKYISHHNNDWRKPPVDVHNCTLEVGELYWIRKPWISDELIKCTFLKITDKGYGFITETGDRVFKKPMYINKYQTAKCKPKLVFCIHQSITIFKKLSDEIEPATGA